MKYLPESSKITMFANKIENLKNDIELPEK
jgi:hypothetical protein